MTTINAQELKKMKDQEGALLVNTLDPEGFAATNIPGSVNIPQAQDDFVKQVEAKTKSKDQPIVVYCASEECNSSPQAAQKLENAGFARVYDFEAGAEGWKEAGEALATR